METKKTYYKNHSEESLIELGNPKLSLRDIGALVGGAIGTYSTIKSGNANAFVKGVALGYVYGAMADFIYTSLKAEFSGFRFGVFDESPEDMTEE